MNTYKRNFDRLNKEKSQVFSTIISIVYPPNGFVSHGQHERRNAHVQEES